MKDTITQERLEELDTIFSHFADPTKTPFEIISNKGKPIVSIGMHVEALSLGSICFILKTAVKTTANA